jgi:hypothetical protein
MHFTSLRSSLFLCVMLLAGCRERPEADAGTDAGRTERDAGQCTMTGAEDNATACGDGEDNDCNGHADCNDFDCCGVVTCDPSTTCGRRDAGTACTPMGTEDTEEACTDGIDNDCNNFADCREFDCCAWRTDCPAGTACGDQAQLCEMRGSENTVEACTDGCDNDGRLGERRFADCEDRGCCLVLEAGGMPCAAGTFCEDRFDPMGVSLCAGDDVTMPAGRESTLADCSNDCDDNRNGFEDCGDRGCCLIREAGGSACAAGTFCADMFNPGDIDLCAGDDVTMEPTTEDDATKCANDCDDDRDGFEDCNDLDCCEARTDCPSNTACGAP